MNNYTILHLHSMYSNPYSGLQVDSITNPEDYIKKAKELNMDAIAFTEHGSVLHNIAKKQICDKFGIKYIHAEEFYVTESLEEKKRDNYHCCLFARNYDGVRELNKLSSVSMNRTDGHFYYTPRITFDELIHTSNNILINTACLAGILNRANSELKNKFIDFLIKNKYRCRLEVQPHNFGDQIEYNKKLYKLSIETGLRLIATNDIHAINRNELDARKLMQKAKNIEFKDEDECDLTFKDYDELAQAFNVQGCLKKQSYLDAIEETNAFAEEIKSYDLDYSHKYPRLYIDSKGEFKKRICKGVKERGIDRLPNFKTEYLPRIKSEIETYVHNDAIDFMLLDSDYKNWMRENGMNYGMSRGSVSGSLIAYLIHSTDVDSVKYDLNFSRFMNSERVSMADIDTDIFADDRYKVREYFFNRADNTKNLFCCNIITFNTIKMRTAIKDIGRAFGLSLEETQEISNTVYEEDKKEYVPDSIRNRYFKLFKYVDLVIDVITSLGRHAAGIVCSPTDLEYDFALATIESDPRPVSQIDMHEIDSLNYVKMDLLGLNAIGLIDKTCKLANIPYRTPDNTDFNDEKVIQSIAEDTTMIFQFESGFASDSLKKVLSDSTLKKIKSRNPDASYIDIIAMTSGAIRPAGESYREQLFNGEYNDNGNKELNDFLAPTLGYLVYQEGIIEFLHSFCGFTMGEADVVRRCVSSDSQILMADDSTKAIKDIEVGDVIKTIDESINGKYKITTNKVIEVYDNHVKRTMKIIATNGHEKTELNLTEDHKVFTLYGWKAAKNLCFDDVIAIYNTHSRTWEWRVIEQNYIDCYAHVYDLQVEENHNYIANYFVVHNCFAKKTGTESMIPIIKNGGEINSNHHIDGFITVAQKKYNMTQSEAEATIEYFLQVILDASDYLFSRNHAVPYSMIGYIIGWLRCYYQIELFTAALNIYQSNKEKGVSIKEYIYSKGYEIRNIKFGKSRAEYFMDKEENVIYQGIESIAYCNSQIGEELYELAQNCECTTFLELLKHLTDTSLNSKQLEILIKLNYFSDYGENQYLLDIYDLYKKWATKKIVKKADLDDEIYYIVRICSNKETEKQFREINNIKLLNILIKDVEHRELPIDEQVKAEYEYLGCGNSYKSNISNKYYLVVDFKTYKNITKPYLTLYNLNNGSIVKTRINKSIIYQREPFGLWDVLEINKFETYKKKKNVDGKWMDSNETELIVDDYIVIKRSRKE